VRLPPPIAPTLTPACSRVTQDSDPGVQAQCFDTLRVMLDPEVCELDAKEKFLALFYARHGAAMAQALQELPRTEAQVSCAHLVVELLSFCVVTHGHLAREFILQSKVVPAVLSLLKSRHKHLVLDVIRFVRACVGCITPSGEFYASFLVDNQILAPVMDVFLRNGDRNNLINSAIIELLDRIAKVRTL
jgi:protein phosphatase-4 regulatory subunit 3